MFLAVICIYYIVTLSTINGISTTIPQSEWTITAHDERNESDEKE